MSKLALQKHREREMAAARTSEEVYALMDQWGREDEAAERANRAETRELAELRKRVARLKKILGPNGKKIIDPLCEAVGQVMPEFFEQQFEKYGALYDAGIWNDSKEYRPGALVTHRGAAWTCKVASRGLRPGDGNGGWRLAVKSAEPKGK